MHMLIPDFERRFDHQAEEEPETPDAVEKKDGHEVLRQQFLTNLQKELAEEHLTVQQLSDLTELALSQISVPNFGKKEGDPDELVNGELSDDTVDWGYFNQMTEEINRGGMQEHIGLRGKVDVQSVRGRSLRDVCVRAIVGIDGATEKITYREMQSKLEEIGVTRKEMYDSIDSVKKETGQLKINDRHTYERGVLKAYLADWEKSCGLTVENLKKFVQLAPMIRNLEIGKLANEASHFKFSVEYQELEELAKFGDVFHFFASLPRILGREIGDRKISDVIELLDLDFKIAMKKIVSRKP